MKQSPTAVKAVQHHNHDTVSMSSLMRTDGANYRSSLSVSTSTTNSSLYSKSAPSSPEKFPSLIPSPNKDKMVAMMMKDADRAIRVGQLSSKLSGTVHSHGYDIPSIDRHGTFVGTHALQLSPLCVRCSAHASICMACCDNQTQEAISFYRKSIGTGASAILNEAIKDAGMINTVKTVIFQLWKNSIQTRIQHMKVMYAQVGTANDIKKYVRPVFLALKKYAKDEIIERKNKYILEMENKVINMEHNMEVAIKDKAHAVSLMKKATERVEDEVFVNDRYKSQIAHLEHEVATERIRVLTLATLCTPIMNLAACCDEHNMDECAFYDPVLIDLGHNVPTHNWGEAFPSSSRDMVIKMTKKREEREKEQAITGLKSNKNELSAEYTESHKLMIHWLNHTSRMINTIDLTTADGDAFDSLLPRHEQIYDFAQLKTGKTLARVVFSLIYFGSELGQIQTELGNNTLYPSELDAGDLIYPESHPGLSTAMLSREQTPSKATKPNDNYWVRVRAIKHRELSDAQINEMKELEDDPEMLIEYALKLASTYLGIPLFRFKDVLTGEVDTIIAMVGLLMFATHPLKEEKDIRDTSKLLGEQTRMTSEMTFCHGRLSYALRAIQEIRRAHDHYLGIEEEYTSRFNETKPTTAATPVIATEITEGTEAGIGIEPTIPSAVAIATPELQIVFDDNHISEKSTMNDSTSPHRKGIKSDSQSVPGGIALVVNGNENHPIETIPEIIETPEQKYAKLGQLIDSLSNRNDLSLLHDAVIELQSHAQQLKCFREDVQSHRLNRDRSARMATDIRCFTMNTWATQIMKPMQILEYN